MSLIFLVGMPGSGKSSMARLWARSYNWNALDMDTMLVKEHGSIGGIFAMHGEVYFRQREREALRRIISEGAHKTIVATGGGTPCFFNNMKEMLQAGCVVYIEATLAQLSRRIRPGSITRPLLAGTDKDERLQRLLETRASIYQQAHFTYPTESLSEATFAEIIDTCTNRRS